MDTSQQQCIIWSRHAPPDVSSVPDIFSTTDDEDVPFHNICEAGAILSSRPPASAGQKLSVDRQSGHSSPPYHMMQRTLSPLSYSALSPVTRNEDSDWDYSETEWWGWVVLATTWCIFVVGLGSCLGVWTWAWDIQKSPDGPFGSDVDLSLPIHGYYPTSLILCGIMAWVWVVAAWVGMKYFRHAKIGGD